MFSKLNRRPPATGSFRLICTGILGALLAGHWVTAAAQDYPTRPIRIIVPTSPGGGTDFTARLIGPKLTEAWGQSVVIENRAGAAGNIGVDVAAKASPDGYTLVIPITSFPINPALYAKLPFDTARDFTPIVLTASAPLLLVVNTSVPANSVSELVALAKARPGALNFANGGRGTSGHLAGELFKRMARIDIASINYKGSGDAMTDVLGGRVHLYFPTIPNGLPHVKAGKLRLLAITSKARIAELPDVPSVAEAGLPGFEIVGWFGLFAPAGTPQPVIAKINREVARILALPDTRERLAVHGLVPGGGTPEDLGAFLKSEMAKYAELVKELGLRAE